MRHAARQILAVAKDVMAAETMLASLAEKEVERLFKVVLPRSPFKNRAFAVGGYVRDELLGIESKDLDVVVDMRGGAEKLTKWLHRQFSQEISRPHQLGRGYPIWSITFKDEIQYKGKTYKTKGAVIEFADSQKEAFPDPESRQRITEPGTLEEDVERRDFTVNMLLKDLSSGELKDLTGTSVNDIKKGLLRGHPGVDFAKILRDDPLRMMRLVRFQAKYGWQVPLDVLKTVKKNAARINIVSDERVRDELVKLADIGKLHAGIKLMKAVGLLKHVMPEIEALRGVEHDESRGTHKEGDVFEHTLLVLKNAKPGLENQFAALLHDAGKPDTQEIIGDTIQYLGHESVSGEIAEAMMRRLKFDRDTVKRVRRIVENHMRPHGLHEAKPKAVRKFIREVGEETIDEVLDLAEADELGTIPYLEQMPLLRKRITEIRESPIPVKRKPVLNGKEIMDALDIKPGPLVGDAGNFLKDMEDEYAEAGRKLTKNEAKKLLLREFT